MLNIFDYLQITGLENLFKSDHGYNKEAILLDKVNNFCLLICEQMFDCSHKEQRVFCPGCLLEVELPVWLYPGSYHVSSNSTSCFWRPVRWYHHLFKRWNTCGMWWHQNCLKIQEWRRVSWDVWSTHCPDLVSLADDAFPVCTRLPTLHHKVVEKQDPLLLPLTDTGSRSGSDLTLA